MGPPAGASDWCLRRVPLTGASDGCLYLVSAVVGVGMLRGIQKIDKKGHEFLMRSYNFPMFYDFPMFSDVFS